MTSDTPPAPTTARAVLAGHADFAAGMASAVTQISGRDDVFVLMTNRGLSGEDIERDLRRALDGGLRVIFTDLPAGSCTLAARRLQRERPDLVLVTGANLATLLDFVFAADEDADPAAAAAHAASHAAEKGRAALAVVPTRPPAEGARGAA
ncbi:PTS system fructose subfamily IIA component [Gemmatirosa kalamazoonensis]|uniref:PTS system fructose subfamily IIA component n=1 Tax=Gemmatirosa kalamazoonensis TaxID=861299 RepID=W0RHS0_9BACT|nr:hypothetical protein [Gemmatirosa kalamazoonensis]AHG90659.1 PTS system fructose subfamily IIA component [Gemmatirosa kalamazoonensis]